MVKLGVKTLTTPTRRVSGGRARGTILPPVEPDDAALLASSAKGKGPRHSRRGPQSLARRKDVLGCFVVHHGADEVDDPATQAAIGQAWKQTRQLQTFRRGDKLGHALGEAVVQPAVGFVEPFEEV